MELNRINMWGQEKSHGGEICKARARNMKKRKTRGSPEMALFIFCCKTPLQNVMTYNNYHFIISYDFWFAWAQQDGSAPYEIDWECSPLRSLLNTMSYSCGWKLILALTWVLTRTCQMEYLLRAFRAS